MEVDRKQTGARLEADWNHTGRRLEADWKQTGSRLEADWKQTGSRLEAENKQIARRIMCYSNKNLFQQTPLPSVRLTHFTSVQSGRSILPCHIFVLMYTICLWYTVSPLALTRT